MEIQIPVTVKNYHKSNRKNLRLKRKKYWTFREYMFMYVKAMKNVGIRLHKL